MLDMPTKNPKTRKKPKVKVGDMVRCEAEGFIYPFRGYVSTSIITQQSFVLKTRWM